MVDRVSTTVFAPYYSASMLPLTGEEERGHLHITTAALQLIFGDRERWAIRKGHDTSVFHPIQTRGSGCLDNSGLTSFGESLLWLATSLSYLGNSS